MRMYKDSNNTLGKDFYGFATFILASVSCLLYYMNVFTPIPLWGRTASSVAYVDCQMIASAVLFAITYQKHRTIPNMLMCVYSPLAIYHFLSATSWLSKMFFVAGLLMVYGVGRVLPKLRRVILKDKMASIPPGKRLNVLQRILEHESKRLSLDHPITLKSSALSYGTVAKYAPNERLLEVNQPDLYSEDPHSTILIRRMVYAVYLGVQSNTSDVVRAYRCVNKKHLKKDEKEAWRYSRIRGKYYQRHFHELLAFRGRKVATDEGKQLLHSRMESEAACPPLRRRSA